MNELHRGIDESAMVDLIDSIGWVHCCLLPFLTMKDLSQLGQTNRMFCNVIKEYGWNNLYIDEILLNKIMKRKSVSVDQIKVIKSNPSKGKYVIRDLSILQIAINNPLRVLHFLSKLDVEQSKIAIGGSSIACGEHHTLIISSKFEINNNEKCKSNIAEISGCGNIYGCGSTYHNLLGIPSVNIEDSDLYISHLVKAGASNINKNLKFTSVAVAKEHSIALEHGGKAIWIWGGKYNYVNQVPVPGSEFVDPITTETMTMKAIGVCVGGKSFAAVLMNTGDVYMPYISTTQIDRENSKQETELRKLYIGERKAKSIAASGSIFALVDTNGKVCIYSINVSGDGLALIAVAQQYFEHFQGSNGNENVLMQVPHMYAIEDTGNEKGKLRVKSISVADRYIAMITENGHLWILGACPISLSSVTLQDLLNGEHQRSRPYRILDDIEHEKVCQVSCAPLHILVMTESGKVFSWGYNSSGRLGLGHDLDTFKPTRINLSNARGLQHNCGNDCEVCPKAVNISAGYNHSAIMLENGNVLTFGGAGMDGRLGHHHYSMITHCCFAPKLVDGFGKKEGMDLFVSKSYESFRKLYFPALRVVKLLSQALIICLHVPGLSWVFGASAPVAANIFELCSRKIFGLP